VNGTNLIRGRVYRAVVDHVEGQKPYLIVSNNQRNAALESVLAVRITTSPKRPLRSIVELEAGVDPLVGRVLCDDLNQLWADEVVADLGAVSPGTMRRVNDALRVALGL
jgi:mRNA interferase MazF